MAGAQDNGRDEVVSHEDAIFGSAYLIIFLAEWIAIFAIQGAIYRQQARDDERRRKAYEDFNLGR